MGYYNNDNDDEMMINLLCGNLHDSEYNTVNDVRGYLQVNGLDGFKPKTKQNYHSVFYDNNVANISKLLQIAIDSEYAVEYSLEIIKNYMACSADDEMNSILWFPPHDLIK